VPLVRHADDGGQADPGVGQQDVFDLARVHVEPATDDHFLASVDDGEVAIGVEPADVAAVEPALLVDRLAGGLGAAEAQSGLWPANCRLLDPVETEMAGAGDGTESVLVMSFESADHPLDAAMRRAAAMRAGTQGADPGAAPGNLMWRQGRCDLAPR
jgi:hypothetical protein